VFDRGVRSWNGEMVLPRYSLLIPVFVFSAVEDMVAAIVLHMDSDANTVFSMGADVPLSILPCAVIIIRLVFFICLGFGMIVIGHVDEDWIFTWGFVSFPIASGLLCVWHFGRLVFSLRSPISENLDFFAVLLLACPVILSGLVFVHAFVSFMHAFTREEAQPDMPVAERLTRRTFVVDTLDVAAGGSSVGGAECLICLMAFEKDDLVKELMCEHLFHAACLDRWLAHCAVSPTAPWCPLRCGPMQAIRNPV